MSLKLPNSWLTFDERNRKTENTCISLRLLYQILSNKVIEVIYEKPWVSTVSRLSSTM